MRPVRQRFQDNLSSRKYCLDCSPFGLHNTKQHSSTATKIKDQEANGLFCAWHTCRKPLRGTQTRFCSKNCNLKDKVTNRRRELKRLAVEYLGGECEMCGYKRCLSALEFHHFEAAHKDFGIAKRGYTRSWDSVRQEIDKCNLVCANCHREIHHEMEKADKGVEPF